MKSNKLNQKLFCKNNQNYSKIFKFRIKEIENMQKQDHDVESYYDSNESDEESENYF